MQLSCGEAAESFVFLFVLRHRETHASGGVNAISYPYANYDVEPPTILSNFVRSLSKAYLFLNVRGTHRCYA